MAIEFEFDKLVELYKEDPAAFEMLKMEMLEKQLATFAANGRSSEAVERLRSKLWRTNKELEKYKNPTVRFNKLVEMFWAEYEVFNKAVTELSKLEADIEADEEPNSETREKATVIPFRKDK